MQELLFVLASMIVVLAPQFITKKLIKNDK